MSDYGLYTALETRIKEALPNLFISGCFPTEEIKPPYGVLQQTPFEPAPLPQRGGRVKGTLLIISRYRGSTELSNIVQKLTQALEGKPLLLKSQVWGVFKIEDISLKQANDHITREAYLTFTVLIRFLLNNLKELSHE